VHKNVRTGAKAYAPSSLSSHVYVCVCVLRVCYLATVHKYLVTLLYRLYDPLLRSLHGVSLPVGVSGHTPPTQPR